MKKIFTLLVAASFGTLAFGQTVFQSDLSSWSGGGNPTDWFGSKTSISGSNVTEVTVGATYGSSMASLVNSGTSHKRFTTENVAVVPGTTYEVKMWVGGLSGELRTNYYNVTDDNYGTYNSYVTLSGGTQTMITQTITVSGTCDSAQFILSLRNTDAAGIILDSVSVTAGTAPVALAKTIYEIQFTTATPADSPYNDSLVETSGVVTAVQYNGYYLQDGVGAWNGVFVLDYSNVPTMGDNVTITGTVDEYFNFTTVGGVIAYSAAAGGTIPNSTTLSTLAVNDEQYEGVLVNVTNAVCNADTTSNAFREWTVNDGSGDLRIDDKMYVFGPTLTTAYNVTGVLDYSFNVFKLLPRMMSDVSVATSIEDIKNVNVSVYPNPVKNNINFELDINAFNVVIVDVTGKTVKTASSLDNKLTVSTSALNNGIYFYTVSSLDGGVISTSKFIVAK